MKSLFCDGITRRDFVKVGVAGMTGLTLSDFLRNVSADEPKRTKADSVLFINLAGGPSHLDTLDMKPEGPVETRGEFKSIPSKLAGLQVCDLLPKFATMADQFTLIRGIRHTSGSHQLGQSYIATGNRPTPALIYPSFGSVVAKEFKTEPDLPPYVAIPKTEWNAGYLGDAYSPFKTNEVPRIGRPFQVRGISLAEGLSIDKVTRRQQLLERIDKTFRQIDTKSQLLDALDKFGQQAHSIITSKRAKAAFDVRREDASIQKLFGEDEFSQSALLATRLIQFGVPFVTVTFAGWDTHLENFKGHRRLLPWLDSGLSGLMQSLQTKGLLERTLVIVMGEFGRTPKINANTGRDHYPRVNWCLLAGGGVQPGQIIGGTDKGGAAPDDSTDIKPDDIGASLLHAIGIDPRKEYFTRTGRPAMLVPHGKVIDGLFA